MLLDIMSLTHSITGKGQDIPMYHVSCIMQTNVIFALVIYKSLLLRIKLMC